MRLINHTLLFLLIILFITVGLWSVLFYSQLLTQVKTTIDEGLGNYKIVIIDKLKDDSLIVEQNVFLDNNYIVKGVSEDFALRVRDSYKDTLIFSTLKNTSYEVRLLTTAFVAANGNYYEMKVISNEVDKGRLMGKILQSLLWLFFFLFIGTLLVNNLVLKKTWKPFYRVLEYLNDFRLDKKTFRELPKTHIKEFSMLNDSIQNLLNLNVDIFNSQKQFIENASHELQTPLAIGINKLELLADEDKLSPDQIKQIGDIIRVFQRLSGLNKSLLLLSKIENKQFVSEEPISFDAIFSRITHDFTDFTEYKKIKISYQKEDNWLFRMNKDLAEMMVLNLVKNAIVHNQPGGELIIRLGVSYFTIENTSDKLQIPSDKLFKRFNKDADNKGSTGLGLAIVKAIADASGLQLSYSYHKRHIFKVIQKSN
ncbi:HAMP domain-containing sensor histidine kinase [uncultured Draconibacterium sp.]|uniref:sensor histidine kinase n=1 Tax=uncultured Draconibacterium sp. TaxID=1573823 RepID=UPI0032166F1D